LLEVFILMEQIIVSYVIPFIAIAMSIVFWLHGRDSAKRAEHLLDEVTKTTRGWQNDIMNSANQMLNARPELAAHQMYMAKIEAVNKLSDAIKSAAEDITKNPKTGEEGEAQAKNLKLLLDYQFHYFNTIIDNKPLPQNRENVVNQSGKISNETDEKQQPK
jgi:hypothetical protein